jgi:geranylgeranyl pyrophosphate synthase
MQIHQLLGGIKELLGSDHPVLESCAKYFFELDGGKKIRPTMVLAVSYALNAQLQSSSDREDGRRGAASPSQRRLAEITEMIHTASLFHDDVLDKVLQICIHTLQQPSACTTYKNSLFKI